MSEDEDEIKQMDIDDAFKSQAIKATVEKANNPTRVVELNPITQKYKAPELRVAIFEYLKTHPSAKCVYTRREIERLKKKELLQLYSQLGVESVSNNETIKQNDRKNDRKNEVYAKMLTNLLITSHSLMERSEPMIYTLTGGNTSNCLLKGLYQNTRQQEEQMQRVLRLYVEENYEMIDEYAGSIGGVAQLIMLETHLLAETILSNAVEDEKKNTQK